MSSGTYTHPGVYVESVPSGPSPIQGVATGALSVVGWTPSGLAHSAQLVTSWPQYVREYGGRGNGFTADSRMPTALYAFFQNGGARAWVVRATPSDADAAVAYIYSDEVVETGVETGDGTTLIFSGTLAGPVVPGSLRFVSTAPSVKTVTDNGSGTLTGVGLASGTINYVTGVYAFTFSGGNAPSVGAITATYDEPLFKGTLKWPGEEGNNYRWRIEGNPASIVTGQGTYTLWNAMVDQLQSDGVTWVEVESFDGVSLTDPTSVVYFPNVVNDAGTGSKIFTIATPSFSDAVPNVLQGTQVLNENVGTGDNTVTAFTDTLLNIPVVPHSVRIDYIDVTAKVITDDGFGNLIGDVDPAGTNTINYTTGAISYKASGAPDVGAILCDYYQVADTTSFTSQATGGDDGTAITSTDVTAAGLEAQGKGIFALKPIQENILIALPDFAGDETVMGALVDFCDAAPLDNRFAIVDPPEGYDDSDTSNFKMSVLAKVSPNAAMYSPWVQIKDPVTNLVANFPPSGHLAGIFARTDRQRGVGKAPAGKEDGQLRFTVGLERYYTDEEMDTIYPVGVNPIIKRTQVGTAVWGARTLDVNGEYRFIQASRLRQYIGNSLYQATHWVNFENNGSDLWIRVRFQVDAFMRTLFRAKMLAGETPAEAYYVVVDESNNPPESVAAGNLFVNVGFAANKPAEFLVYRLAQKTATT